MKTKQHKQIKEIDPTSWNALVDDDYPFLKHDFLNAMERHGCVGDHAGWIPNHLALYDDDDKLIGAMPLYEKHNSWGEFVFDHAWADAYHRAGFEYYPKLVNAIPFTPASGQRILAKPSNRKEIITALSKTAQSMMHQNDFSGIHSLFIKQSDYDTLTQPTPDQLHEIIKPLTRHDCQFHWHNNDYQNIDEFLANLKLKKRKNIRQERRKVHNSGVTIRRLNGHSATEKDWHEFNRMYREIYHRKYGAPAFNLNFFLDIADKLPDQILLVMAYAGEQAIASALMYHDNHTLYGRHWGCHGYVDSLHFELCYYQGIEFCIERGLKRFDPGAQGEHKIARGFIPTQTKSLHWIAAMPFQQAIKNFVEREQSGVKRYMQSAHAHSPYR